jgi:hypothetical protein
MTSGWLTFWEISLIVSSVAFAFISVVVALRGFGDLRQMMAELSRTQPGANTGANDDRSK